MKTINKIKKLTHNFFSPNRIERKIDILYDWRDAVLVSFQKKKVVSQLVETSETFFVRGFWVYMVCLQVPSVDKMKTIYKIKKLTHHFFSWTGFISYSLKEIKKKQKKNNNKKTKTKGEISPWPEICPPAPPPPENINWYFLIWSFYSSYFEKFILFFISISYIISYFFCSITTDCFKNSEWLSF